MQSQLQHDIDQLTPDHPMVEASILALTASIERLETLPHPRRNPELVKRLRRHRGAFKLYRDGVFDEPPTPIYRPLIISCAPCPAMDFPPGDLPESDSIIEVDDLVEVPA